MASVISTGCTLHSRAGAGKAAEEVQVRVTRSPEVALLGPDTSTVEGRSGEGSGEESGEGRNYESKESEDIEVIFLKEGK